MRRVRKIEVLVLLLAVMIQLSVFAAENHGRDIEIIMEEILIGTQSETISEISPEEVSPSLLEELGDAVMGLLLDDDWRHERMDAMLGGEGSYQLAAYHRDLGEQYLLSGGELYDVSYSGGWMMPGGMMGFSRYRPYRSGWNSAPFYSRSNWYWGLPILIGIVVLGILAVVIPLRRRRGQTESEALTILKNRFVRGEISQQEYARMKKILGR